MTYQDALEHVLKGHFQRVIEHARTTEVWRSADYDFRSLMGYVLAATGDTATAARILNFDVSRLTSGIRSQVETSLGMISWSTGNREASARHFQSAIKYASDARSPERAAWAHLHLFRLASEVQPIDAVSAILRDVRKAVMAAPTPALSAYLHVCVAAFEGQRGQLDEATRHCDIAESLLESEPHAWILGGCYTNRSCVACLRCDFDEATRQVNRVVELTAVNGSLQQRTAAQLTLAYIHLFAGHFPRAEATLKPVISAADQKRWQSDAADILARVYLATGQLDKCDATLHIAGFETGQLQTGDSAYGMRWAALTKAKLLLRRLQFQEAFEWLSSLNRQTFELKDRPFTSALHLLTAQALHRLGRDAEAARRILEAELSVIRESKDLQGQFHYTLATMVADASRLSSQLERRATRIWSNQGVVSVRSEIDDGVRPAGHDTAASPNADGDLDAVRTVINAVASTFDLADNPRLLGAELLALLDATGCAADASLTETSDAPPDRANHLGRRLNLRLGEGARGGKSVMLSCDVPHTPIDAVAAADVFRIGRAAIALEKARRDDRKRAALWPAEPIEDQAGALFIAAEMQNVLAMARRIAAINIPVLITGETGTGKEVVARLIHSYSPRASKTFLPFNCTATPRDMLDAQLFGHRKGAFTGATENFSGVIRAAGGGTLFLDEIGESTLEIQPKLLRFLESSEVHPIGESHPQRVDTRVIAATNADIDALVAQGRFREDLFYRLNIIRLQIPPLRERRVEVPSFANHYLQKYAKEMDKGELRLAEETKEYLVLYRWPGNVRQLANEMRRLAALAERNAVLMPEHLSADIAASRRTMPASERTLDVSEIVVRLDQPFDAAIAHVGRAVIQAAMAKTNSFDEAAKLLGLSRKGLYLKRSRYGLEIDRPRNGGEVVAEEWAG